MTRYTIDYERDEAGWWIARVHGVPGVHSNGRTIAEARRRVREALGLAIGDVAADTAELTDHVKLPRDLTAELSKYRKARKSAESAQQRVMGVSQNLARKLTRKLGLSVRDIGELLDLSHQRVQQLKG